MSIIGTLKEQLSIEPLLSASNLVVAYSGGIDSHVLLHALHSIKQADQLNFQLSAIHIHHGLSQHADQWQKHCEKFCVVQGLPFKTANVKVMKQAQQSLEAQAREIRYAKLAELAPDGAYIVLAQHQDDQLETFLLQLKRGAGPKGLSAMNPNWTVNANGESNKQVHFFRPMLNVTQQNILDYAEAKNLSWVEDESNQNTDFDRNFLRQRVLPVLQTRWPEIANSVSRSAQLCAEQQGLLDEVAAEKLDALKTSQCSLNVFGLNELGLEWLNQVVRYWLADMAIQSPSQAVLSKLKSQVLDASDDANPILQWQGWQFRRFDQQLFVVRAMPQIERQFIEWKGQAKLVLPEQLGLLVFTKKSESEGLELLVDLESGPVTIQFGGFSQRFTPIDSKHSKPLKQWFKQWKVPPWERNNVVILKQENVAIALLIAGNWQKSAKHKIQSTNLYSVDFIPM